VPDYLAFLRMRAEKERDQWIHRQWCQLLPFMYMKQLSYVSFQDYKDQITGRNLDRRDTDVIVNELKQLHGLE